MTTHTTKRRLRTAGAMSLFATTLLLTACGGDAATSGTAGASESSSSSSATADEGASTEFNDADVMFAQMMLPHHRQAVEMADTVLAKPDVDERVLALAEQITSAQEPEIAQLTGFLETWGQEVPVDGAMGGMDMGGGMDPSGGMMSEEQMQQLVDATGVDASQVFLEQMVQHHTGALEMAQTELEEGQSPEALDLAQTIVDAQEAEITQMQEILASL